MCVFVLSGVCVCQYVSVCLSSHDMGLLTRIIPASCRVQSFACLAQNLIIWSKWLWLAYTSFKLLLLFILQALPQTGEEWKTAGVFDELQRLSAFWMRGVEHVGEA